MKKYLFVLTAAFMFNACKDSKNKTYNNDYVILEKKGFSEQNGNFFFIRRVANLQETTELNENNWAGLNTSCECHRKDAMRLIAKRKQGDTLYFDYIAKDRFIGKRKK